LSLSWYGGAGLGYETLAIARSSPPEQGIHQPAASNLLSLRPAKWASVGIVAAGSFEGIGHGWQEVEGSILGKGLEGISHARGQRRPIDAQWSEGVAENVPHQAAALFAVARIEGISDCPCSPLRVMRARRMLAQAKGGSVRALALPLMSSRMGAGLRQTYQAESAKKLIAGSGDGHLSPLLETGDFAR